MIGEKVYFLSKESDDTINIERGTIVDISPSKCGKVENVFTVQLRNGNCHEYSPRDFFEASQLVEEINIMFNSM